MPLNRKRPNTDGQRREAQANQAFHDAYNPMAIAAREIKPTVKTVPSIVTGLRTRLGSAYLSTSARSYHHYDVTTQVCTNDQPSCNLATIRDVVGRYYSYPALGLNAQWTLVDGVEMRTAYIAPPFYTDKSS
jgi:hypothetical protein